MVRPSDPEALDGTGFFVLPSPGGPYNTRGAYVVRIEGDLWLAGLGGRFGDYPPADVDQWREFGRTLAHPIWDEVLTATELVTKPAPFRFPRSVRRHFERLDRFPDGLVPVGDSVCHFNPLYGQGMSAAACQARALKEVLERRSRGSQDLTGLALEFFPEAFEVTRTPWALAAAADFRDRRTTGDFPVEELPSLEMFQLAASLADTDPEAARLTADIATLVRPLSALHTPPWPERLARARRARGSRVTRRRPRGTTTERRDRTLVHEQLERTPTQYSWHTDIGTKQRHGARSCRALTDVVAGLGRIRPLTVARDRSIWAGSPPMRLACPTTRSRGDPGVDGTIALCDSSPGVTRSCVPVRRSTTPATRWPR